MRPNRNLLEDLGGSQPQAPKAPRDYCGHCPEEMIRGMLTTPTPDARDPSKEPDHPGLRFRSKCHGRGQWVLGGPSPFLSSFSSPCLPWPGSQPCSSELVARGWPTCSDLEGGHRGPLRGAHTAVADPHTGCPTCLPPASQHCSPSNGGGGAWEEGVSHQPGTPLARPLTFLKVKQGWW